MTAPCLSIRSFHLSKELQACDWVRDVTNNDLDQLSHTPLFVLCRFWHLCCLICKNVNPIQNSWHTGKPRVQKRDPTKQKRTKIFNLNVLHRAYADGISILAMHRASDGNSIDFPYFIEGTRKTGPNGFPVCGSSNVHERSPFGLQICVLAWSFL